VAKHSHFLLFFFNGTVAIVATLLLALRLR
jgi:hypothetical protein